MTPPLSAVLARLMGRQPTLGELEEVRRSAVRDAMVAVMGEPAEPFMPVGAKRLCGRVSAGMFCTRDFGHPHPCHCDAPVGGLHALAEVVDG